MRMKQAHLHEGLRIVSTVFVFAVVTTALFLLATVLAVQVPVFQPRPGGILACGRTLALEPGALGSLCNLRLPEPPVSHLYVSWSLRGWCED